jgi:hypothetical protein
MHPKLPLSTNSRQYWKAKTPSSKCCLGLVDGYDRYDSAREKDVDRNYKSFLTEVDSMLKAYKEDRIGNIEFLTSFTIVVDREELAAKE